jgi:hypothetical protein
MKLTLSFLAPDTTAIVDVADNDRVGYQFCI